MSFRRNKHSASKPHPEGDGDETRKISGVKPWINGSYLVSTGNRNLDDLIGGGQGLGTLLMIESDSFSNYGESIISYGVAQALSSGHKVLVLTDSVLNPETLASMLPYNLNVGKCNDSVQHQNFLDSCQNKDGQIATVSNPNFDDDCSTIPVIGKKADESGLKIAWQYEKYVVEGRDRESQKKLVAAEQSSQYCCSFDLSRRLQPFVWRLNSPEIFSIDDGDGTHRNSMGSDMSNLECALTAMRSVVVKFLANNHQQRRDKLRGDRDNSINSVTSVSRIFIPQLANLAADYGSTYENARRIVQFILDIKQLVRNIHATVVFTLSPQSCPQILLSRLQWVADTVLSVDSFAGKEQSVPYEFKEFCGLLTVMRVQQVGSIASFRPPGSKFGLRRDSRKLHIEPLHLPPEESRTGTAGTAAAVAVTSAAMDGFTVATAPTAYNPEGRGRIEIKMDTSIAVKATPITSPVSNFGGSFAAAVGESYSQSEGRSPSKYEEKGAYDRVDAGNGNIAARSIFARARAEGLLPGPRGVGGLNTAGKGQQKTPPLTPGSACAPTRPGGSNTSSLDF